MIIKNNKTTSAYYKGTKEIVKRYKGTLVVYEGFKKLIAEGVPITLQNCKKTNLLDYKIYGNTIQDVLPETYQQVEYIESTGEETLSTGYIDKPGTRIELDFVYTSIYAVGTEMAYIGANAGNLLTISNGYISIAGNSSTDIVATPNTRYNVILERDASGLRTGIINGVQKTGTKNTSAINNFFLVGLGGSTTSSKICGKIYSCKIYDTDVLVRDMIPCYRKSDGKVGMYDLVNDVFYTNTGDGELTKGMAVPNTETPIEIESVGDKTKNLFNEKDLLKYNVNRDYYTVDKDGVTLVRSHGSAWTDLDTLVTLSAGTYSMSTTIQDVARVQIYDENNSAIVSEKVTPLSFTLTETKKLKIKILSRTSYPTFIGHIQIEKSDVVTEYEPYGYKIPVKVSGKNLLNPSKFSGGSLVDYNGVQCYKYKDAANNFTYTDDFKENTQYSFSIRIFSEGEFKNTSFNIVYTDGTTTTVSIKDYDTVYSVTSSSDKTIKKIVGSFNWSITRYIDLSVSQLEEGTITTTFEPYHEPITTNIYLNEPLRKIDDYVDYLDFENKKVVRNIYHEFITTIAGTSSLSGTYKIFLCFMEKTPYFRSQVGFAISNKFIRYEGGYPTLPSNGGCIQSYITSAKLDRMALTFNDPSIKTLEQAQEKIGDGFDVCYILAEPIIEENVELPDILLNKGTNIIEVVDTVIPTNMKVKYFGKGEPQTLSVTENIILNSILDDGTETEIDMFEEEILQKLDEIIGD